MKRWSAWLLAVSGLAWFTACHSDGKPPTGLTAPSTTELRGLALAIDVDLNAGSATVHPANTRVGPSGLSFSINAPTSANYAILGRNEISASVSNLTRSQVGEFTPYRVRVRFDLSLTNRLLNSDLVPSTFPTAPINEIVAFPFSTEPSALFGLRVKASSDWNGDGSAGSGALYNFFNDAVCVDLTPPSDCYRWEAFGASLQAGGQTATRSVGFDIDPSVTSFTVYVAVAADIRDRAIPAGKGSIAGNVTSPTRGALSNVTVMALPAGAATTNATGFYSLSNIDPGSVSVSVTGLPNGCAPPAAQNATVTAGAVTEVSFQVNCAPAGAGTAIFVSPSGDDANQGNSPSAPVKTIAMGMSRAVQNGLAEVHVAAGVYQESVNLITGISLLGGYNGADWSRDPGVNLTSINGLVAGTPVVTASAASNATISGFSIQAPNATSPGASSYAIRIFNSTGITIANNRIVAGAGQAGLNGLTGADGLNGVDGFAGTARANTTAGTGGSGGARICGPNDVSGGRAGSGGQLAADGTAGLIGRAGIAPNGGAAGAGGVGGIGGTTGGRGGDGANGASGTDGLPGTAGSNLGTFQAFSYVPAPGASGLTGGNGGGAGGGGGGGSWNHGDQTETLGALGGNGGSGGGSGACGGQGGGGGAGGGGSFAIVVLNSTVTIQQNFISTSVGGNGGNGGLGGRGGFGGFGAAAVVSTDDPALQQYGGGGAGGRGGNGGGGGAGGGGGGGPSIGIFTVGSTGVTATDNTFSIGAGGAGGSGGTFAPNGRSATIVNQ